MGMHVYSALSTATMQRCAKASEVAGLFNATEVDFNGVDFDERDGRHLLTLFRIILFQVQNRECIISMNCYEMI